MSPNMLSRTLAIKERLRQWRRAELQEANTEVARAQERVDEQAVQQHQATAAVTAKGEISANDLALHAEQLERTQLALRKAREILSKSEAERDDRRDQVGEATREMKAIEVLRDRAVEEQRRAQVMREQRDADEHSSRKGRKRL